MRPINRRKSSLRINRFFGVGKTFHIIEVQPVLISKIMEKQKKYR